MATSGKSKHRHIYEYLRQAIDAGELAIGQQVPTEAELSAQFGACRQTVAHALRQLEHQGLVTRRRGAGTFVRPHNAKKGTLLGLVVPEAHGGIFAPISAQMTRVARDNGFGLVFSDPHDPSEAPARTAQRMDELAREYIARELAGVFFMPLLLPPNHTTINVRFADTLDAAGIPVILLDRDVYDYPRRSKYDLVGVANRRATQLLTEHLLAIGRRRIHYITHPQPASTATARIEGYRDALRDHGITPEAQGVHAVDLRDAGFADDVLPTTQADAFVCLNDAIAAYLIRHLIAAGVAVPDDVAVVGFDDVDYATLVPVPLTTMRQPCGRIGEMAVRLMLERLPEPGLPAREVTFPCELIVRESCGARRLTRTAQHTASG